MESKGAYDGVLIWKNGNLVKNRQRKGGKREWDSKYALSSMWDQRERSPQQSKERTFTGSTPSGSLRPEQGTQPVRFCYYSTVTTIHASWLLIHSLTQPNQLLIFTLNLALCISYNSSIQKTEQSAFSLQFTFWHSDSL